MKFSVGCFGLCIVAILVQQVPSIGIFMMLLLAPFWSVVLINLGFAALGVEAFTGAWPRWAIVFPVMWFGGYEFATTISHIEAWDAQRQIIAANDRVHLSWNPQSQDIVVYGGRSGIDQMSDEGLVVNYGVRRVIASSENSLRPSRSTELVPGPCPQTVVDEADGSKSIYLRAISGGMFTGERLKSTPDICTKNSQTQAAANGVELHFSPLQKQGGFVEIQTESILVRNGDASPMVLTAGSVQALSWLPIPIAGCFLNDGSSSWDCQYGFGREPTSKLFIDAEDVVARALGLTKMPLAKRYPQLNWN